MTSKKICNYHKFGFCRLRSQCPDIHLNEICEKDTCDLQNCDKRHPVPCRLLAQGECKFNQGCMFSHRRPKKLRDLEEKVKIIENENKNLKLKCENQDSTIEVLKEKILSMEGNLLAVMKFVQKRLIDKPNGEHLSNSKHCDTEPEIMEFATESSNVDTIAVTIASDDQGKNSKNSVVVENGIENDIRVFNHIKEDFIQKK